MSHYDVIYQCSIEEYAKWHNTTVENLINKVAKDIQLMCKAKNTIFDVAYEDERDLTDEEVATVQVINSQIEKKRKHIKRLTKWKD